jgi:hypothetical protein
MLIPEYSNCIALFGRFFGPRGYFYLARYVIPKNLEVMPMSSRQSNINAEKLLLEYRHILWRIKALESVVGVESEALKRSKEQARFTQELVGLLRDNKLLGEKLHRIIYATYMTLREPSGIDEILSNIKQDYEEIPRRTYFRLRARALEMLDGYLKSL